MTKVHDIQELFTQLEKSEGIQFNWDEEAVNTEFHTIESRKTGLAIKILSMVGGFLSMMAFLGFLLIAGLYDSETGMVLTGICFILAALVLTKKYDKVIIDTASIAVFIAGFALLGFGLNELNVEEHLISLLFLIFAASSMLIMRNAILIFISVLIMAGSILSLVVMDEIFNLVHLYNAASAGFLAWWMLKEPMIISRWKKYSVMYDPIRAGLIFSLLTGLVMVGKQGLVPLSAGYIWLSSVATIPIVLLLIARILDTLGIKNQRDQIIIYCMSTFVLLPTVFAPSISGALLIILLSYFVNYKTGLAAGIISLICFISLYYYDLTFTLLVKSVILFSSGILFLLFYYLTSKHHDYEKL